MESRDIPADLKNIDPSVDKRILVIEVDPATGDITWDDETFAPWELIGIAAVIDAFGHSLLDSNEDDDSE